MSLQLVIVHDLNVQRAFRCPQEADAELIVNADAMLSGALSFQSFQPIARRYAEIIESSGPVQHCQLAHGNGFDVRKAFDAFAAEQALRIGTLEGPDRHKQILTICVSIVKS